MICTTAFVLDWLDWLDQQHTSARFIHEALVSLSGQRWRFHQINVVGSRRLCHLRQLQDDSIKITWSQKLVLSDLATFSRPIFYLNGGILVRLCAQTGADLRSYAAWVSLGFWPDSTRRFELHGKFFFEYWLWRISLIDPSDSLQGLKWWFAYASSSVLLLGLPPPSGWRIRAVLALLTAHSLLTNTAGRV